MGVAREASRQDDAISDGKRSRLRSILHLKFAAEDEHMPCNGVLTDKQCVRDLLIRPSSSQVLEDLNLPGRERCQQVTLTAIQGCRVAICSDIVAIQCGIVFVGNGSERIPI